MSKLENGEKFDNFHNASKFNFKKFERKSNILCFSVFQQIQKQKSFFEYKFIKIPSWHSWHSFENKSKLTTTVCWNCRKLRIIQRLF